MGCRSSQSTTMCTVHRFLWSRLQTFFEHVSVLNSQAVLIKDVTSYEFDICFESIFVYNLEPWASLSRFCKRKVAKQTAIRRAWTNMAKYITASGSSRQWLQATWDMWSCDFVHSDMSRLCGFRTLVMLTEMTIRTFKT